MATHANTTPVVTEANRLKREAFQKGKVAERRVRVFSDVVADAMESIHGGEWGIVIDHERQAVMIYRTGAADVRIQPSQLREVV